jgi:hypothetical protein
LSIKEEDYPKKYHSIIRRLFKAISTPQLRNQMNVEDEYVYDYQRMERLVQKKTELVKIQSKKLEIKEKMILERENELKAKNNKINENIKLLFKQGVDLETISKINDISIDELKSIVSEN